MRRLLKALIVCFTIFALVLASGVGADAKKKHHHKKKHKKNSASSTLTIDSASGSTIRGDLSSPRDQCVEDRIVRVTRGNTAIGSATTDSNGGWTVLTNAPVLAGEQITARVDKVTRGTKKKKIDCGADTDNFTVPGATAGQQQTLNVNVTRQAGGAGRVDSNPAGISNCRQPGDPGITAANPSDCTQAYIQGTDVTLTALADAGSVFVNWSGCDTINGNQCTVDMTRTRNVAASFNNNGGPAVVPEVCAPTGTALDPVLCLVIGLLGGN